MTEGTSHNRDELLRDAAERAIQYLTGLESRTVGVAPGALDQLVTLDEPLPESGVDTSATLALLDEIGSPATTATAGGRFFGYVIGGTLPAALAANWLAAAWDQDAGMASMCPINATLEEVARRWLLGLLRLPAASGAAFVTGGTMANFAALAAARHAVLAAAGWDVEADGMFAAPPVTVVVSDEVHVSVLKALGLLGFGRQRVVRVPVDRQGRLRAEALPMLAGPTIVCLQAGNVNTGAIDPLREHLCQGACGRGVGAHRRRLWSLGRGGAESGAPRGRRRRGRLVGRRRAQVAQRSLRQRDRLRAGGRSATSGDGGNSCLPGYNRDA